MDLNELVRAILAGDLLAARQHVADAYREPVRWKQLDRPAALDDRELTVAAAVVELLASRIAATPPSWTSTVGALGEMVVLDPGLEEMPRSFARVKSCGPEPFLRRNLIASPDFLDVS
jgi:hypothetical protein